MAACAAGETSPVSYLATLSLSKARVRSRQTKASRRTLLFGTILTLSLLKERVARYETGEVSLTVPGNALTER